MATTSRQAHARLRPVWLVLVVLLCCLLVVAVRTPTRASGAPNGHVAVVRPTRLMPLGDSLTEGWTVSGGYRPRLVELLEAGGHDVNLVGSRSSGPPELVDRQHEGHGGWTIAEIAAQVDGWIHTARPDLVLLLVGTNDVLERRDADAPERLGNLLRGVACAHPRVHVLVSTVPPLAAVEGDPGRPWRVRRYNQGVTEVVAALRAEGAKVTLVDAAHSLEEGDLADGVHLTSEGYARLAGAWHEAVVPLLPTGMPTTTATSVPALSPVAAGPTTTVMWAPRIAQTVCE